LLNLLNDLGEWNPLHQELLHRRMPEDARQRSLPRSLPRAPFFGLLNLRDVERKIEKSHNARHHLVHVVSGRHSELLGLRF